MTAKTIRRKVRLTDDELYRLHLIADEQIVSATQLLRNSTLNPSLDSLFEVLMTDIYSFSTAISSLDYTAKEFISKLKDPADCSSTLRRIDDGYGQLRKSTIQARQAVCKESVRLLTGTIKEAHKPLDAVAIHDFFLGMDSTLERLYSDTSGPKHGISVSFTEEEYSRVQAIANECKCPVTSLLKGNVFLIYRKARTLVSCSPLDQLTENVRTQMQFLSAICEDTKSRIPTVSDANAFSGVLNEILSAIQAQITNLPDIAAVKDEARIHVSEYLYTEP